MKHLTAFFKNLSIELISEDADVSKCTWDNAAKHWTIAVTDDTPTRVEFDYYGGKLATIADETDLLFVLQNLLEDALVIIEGEGNYYEDSIDYLINELGLEYKDAKIAARGCKAVYNKLSKIFDFNNNGYEFIYDYLNELSDAIN